MQIHDEILIFDSTLIFLTLMSPHKIISKHFKAKKWSNLFSKEVNLAIGSFKKGRFSL